MLLTIGLALHAQANEASQDQLDALKARIDKLQHWLDSARGEQAGLQKKLRATEQKIGRVLQQLSTLTEQQQAAENRLETLTQKRETLRRASAQQARQIARQVRAAYGIGKQPVLKMLLNQEQPAALARTLRYYDYFNRARAREIAEYANTAEQLAHTQQRIDEELATLKRARDSKARQHAALEQSQTERQAVITSLQREIHHKGEKLDRMLADQQRLEALIKSVEETVATLDLPDATTPISQLKGKLPAPVAGKLVKRFGAREPNSDTRWNGVLIGAQAGQDVQAVHHGRVVFADWLRGFGLLLILDHGNGYMSLYGHNQSLYRETGDWVNRQEVISSVGNSGGQDRTGLYFEIRHNGKPKNPADWVSALR